MSTSDNFRAITLRSILCKLLDVVILTKEKGSLCTNDRQYGFKQGSSTSLCTAMVQETISYYVHSGSNVYVNYCKLFRISLDKKVCPLYCRLLLNMYLNQKFRLRWDSTHSQYFNVSNGVKQGCVISLILF